MGEPVQQPFWSPDSKAIGFCQDGKLRKVTLEGAVQSLIDVPGQNFGGSWGADGFIVYSTGSTDGIMRVAADGGSPSRVTALDSMSGEVRHLWPRLLPDGRHFLYQAQAGAATLTAATRTT